MNLTMLGFFKYFNFFIANFYALLSQFGFQVDAPTLHILLPVGISFFTFQSMSYTIDVYRRQIEPTPDFLDYALFVSFFPQLVAGPIERAKNLLPQIQAPRKFREENLTEGFLLIYWGLFKKLFIADNLAAFISYADSTLALDGATGNGGLILVSTYAFMFQLYCDFSGYSDIARGTARLMGFDIMLNFRAPFFSKNIQEIWNRWHISLTSWIRDYLFFPLAKVKIGKRYLNARVVVILTFLIMGLWHGASWNFILWGGYNGLILIIYTSFVLKTRRFRNRKPTRFSPFIRVLSVLATFHVAAFGLLFFRASSLHQIGIWTYHLVTDISITPDVADIFLRVLLYISPLLVIDFHLYHEDELNKLWQMPAFVKYGFLYVTFYLIIVFSAPAGNFIYFQF